MINSFILKRRFLYYNFNFAEKNRNRSVDSLTKERFVERWCCRGN